MRFLHPEYLGWLSVALLVAALFFFRRRPRKVRVSTLPFFKSLAREYQENPWLRWLKRILSLLISLAIVGCVVLALARLVISPPADSLRTVVILMDCSASMAALDDNGVTRFDEARRHVSDRLAGLPSCVGVMVMAYDRRPEVVLSRTLDRREVRRALDRLAVRPVAGSPERARVLAMRFAGLDAPAEVWHATDAGGTIEPVALSGEAGDVYLRQINAGLPERVNAGITAFSMRPRPLDHLAYDVLVEVHAAGEEAVPVSLEIRLDGQLRSLRKLALAPGSSERLVVPVEAGDADTMSLRVKAEGDCLPLDDEVHANLPEATPVRVLWVAEEHGPFMELALAALQDGGGIEVFKCAPQAYPPSEPYDVVVFDRWLPEEWPDSVAVLAIAPPRTLGPTHAVRLKGEGLPVESVRTVDATHPLLYGVANRRAAVLQTAVLQADGPLRPLWQGPKGPLLLAGDVRGQRITVFAFDPERSEKLPLMASYPLLIGNAIFWAARPLLDDRGGGNRLVGDLVQLDGNRIEWTVPQESGAMRRIGTTQIAGKWTELDRIGLWTADTGERGSAMLLSREETLLQGASGSERADDESPLASPSAWLAGDLRNMILWAVLILLMVESYLFHRWALY